jgi:hypothetical protein
MVISIKEAVLGIRDIFMRIRIRGVVYVLQQLQYVKLKNLPFVNFTKLKVKSGILAIFETILKFEITIPPVFAM